MCAFSFTLPRTPQTLLSTHLLEIVAPSYLVRISYRSHSMFLSGRGAYLRTRGGPGNQSSLFGQGASLHDRGDDWRRLSVPRAIGRQSPFSRWRRALRSGRLGGCMVPIPVAPHSIDNMILTLFKLAPLLAQRGERASPTKHGFSPLGSRFVSSRPDVFHDDDVLSKNQQHFSVSVPCE